MNKRRVNRKKLRNRRNLYAEWVNNNQPFKAQQRLQAHDYFSARKNGTLL